MKIIGLTGGIGSGKTTVANIFSSLGVPVFNADYEAKELYKNPDIIRKTIEILGNKDIIDSNGEIIKSQISAIIFTDPLKRTALNNLIHPLVKKRFSEWISQNPFNYCIREAAILIESDAHRDCDKIIVVTSPLKDRVERVMQRDGDAKNEVEKRILTQMKDEERIKFADFIIENDKTPEYLHEQVLKIHQQLL